MTPVLVAPIVSSNNPPPNTPVTITEPIPTGVTGPVTFYNGTTPLRNCTDRQRPGYLDCPFLAGRHKSDHRDRYQYINQRHDYIASHNGNCGEGNCHRDSGLVGEPVGGQSGYHLFCNSTCRCNWYSNLPRWHNYPRRRNNQRRGVATFTTSTFTIGSHSITASYGGDSCQQRCNFGSFDSGCRQNSNSDDDYCQRTGTAASHGRHLYCKRNCSKPECHWNSDLYGRHDRIGKRPAECKRRCHRHAHHKCKCGLCNNESCDWPASNRGGLFG